MATRKKVVVSPDISVVPTSVPLVQGDAVLVPMAEWKQAAIRATRATAPALAVLGAGGTAASAATGAGLPPLLMVGLPSTGVFLLDTIGICLLIWLLWFAWNLLEFWMDWDETSPRARA